MRPKRSTIKTTKLEGRRKAQLYTLGFLFVIILLLPLTGTAEEAPISVSLILQERLGGSAIIATDYLGKLLEQRTDNRLKVTIHTFSPGSETASELSANLQMAVIDSLKSLGESHRLTGAQSQPVSEQLSSYQLVIDTHFLHTLSDDLKIILYGDIEDTKRYLLELEKN